MLNWSESNFVSLEYVKVRRVDKYEILQADGLYEIDINAKLKGKPAFFEMQLSGDTNARNNSEIKEFIDLNKNVDLLKERVTNYRISYLNEEKLRKLLIIGHHKNRKHHRYKIKCLWKGTFGHNLEYIHIPWKKFYRIPGEYAISIKSDKKLKSDPILFTLDEAVEVFNIIERTHELPKDIGLKAEVIDDCYCWNFKEMNDNYMIVWVS